jgi:hypothetical protein
MFDIQPIINIRFKLEMQKNIGYILQILAGAGIQTYIRALISPKYNLCLLKTATDTKGCVAAWLGR